MDERLKNQLDQLQTIMELNLDFIDLHLEEEELLYLKFKFLELNKYSGTNDPYLYLKQYITYVKAIGLTKTQIVKQFSMS